MAARDRSKRTASQKLQRALALPFVYLVAKPILMVAEWLGMLPALSARLSQLRYGDIWTRCWHGYEPDERDVIVCSYMKSGTNWMLQIAYQIIWLGEGEFDHLHDVVPWPDEVTKGYAIDLRDETAVKVELVAL